MRNFEDRISQLPDEILVSILSLYNIVEASRTCVVSKRWQYLWTHGKVLHFYFPKMLRAIDRQPLWDCLATTRWHFARTRSHKYVHWVNRVIQLHQCPDITDFKVIFPLSGEEFRDDIDEWLIFAICKSVQRIEVNLCGYTRLGERCDLFGHGHESCYIEYNPTYTPTYKVYSLVKSPYGLSCIKSLTQLSLAFVNVCGELVEHFLSNCPLLLGLRVLYSENLVNLKIAGPSLRLKFLELSCCHLLQTVDVYAQNLASLISLGYDGRTPVCIRHAPSLVDLTVASKGSLDVLPASSFSQLESLTLSFDLYRERAPPSFPEFTYLKNLTFAGFAGKKHSFLAWTSLIERAPLLRTFTLQLMSPTRIRTRVKIEPTDPRPLHRCLEVVKFVGNIDIELLAYFLGHAVALKAIIVNCRHPVLEPWQKFKEDKRSMELRNHALFLKGQLAPIIEVVICSKIVMPEQTTGPVF